MPCGLDFRFIARISKADAYEGDLLPVDAEIKITLPLIGGESISRFKRTVGSAIIL